MNDVQVPDICIIKLSGKVTDSPQLLQTFCQSLKVLIDTGIYPIVVHGGGRQLTELSKRLGIETTFVNGRRVTSPETLEAAQMAFLGLVQPSIVAALGRAGISAVGLNGADGRTLIAIKRPVREVDYGHVGDIVVIQTALIHALLQASCVAVVGPLATAPDGSLLNVNADTVAAELALAFKAKKLIMISDTPGVMTDPNRPETLLAHLSLKDAESMSRNGVASDGMLPKLSAVARALSGTLRHVTLAGPEALPNLDDLVSGRTTMGTIISTYAAEELA